MSEPSELQETMTYLVNKALDEWGESDPRCTAAKMIAAGLADLEARLEKLEVERASSLDRDFLGRLVRQAWVEWAKEQPNPKSSWLEPWDDLSEDMKEADRRIGEHVASCCVTPELLIVEARLEEVERERDEAQRQVRYWKKEAMREYADRLATAKGGKDGSIS